MSCVFNISSAKFFCFFSGVRGWASFRASLKRISPPSNSLGDLFADCRLLPLIRVDLLHIGYDEDNGGFTMNIYQIIQFDIVKARRQHFRENSKFQPERFDVKSIFIDSNASRELDKRHSDYERNVIIEFKNILMRFDMRNTKCLYLDCNKIFSGAELLLLPCFTKHKTRIQSFMFHRTPYILIKAL